jgi:hypothetical protein
MYWPVFNMRKLERKMKNTRLRSGVSCTYVRWTKHVGLKVYGSAKQRNRCVKYQTRAAKADLGPKVGESFDIEVFCYTRYNDDDDWAPTLRMKKLYCYFTEHVERPTRRQRRFQKIKALDLGLCKIGINHTDLHADNIGMVRKKLVCLDFDSASCYSFRPRKSIPIYRSYDYGSSS